MLVLLFSLTRNNDQNRNWRRAAASRFPQPRAALCRIRLGGTISEQSVVFQSLGGKQQQVLVFLCVLLLSHILFPHQMSQRMQDSVEMVTILSFALQVTLDRLWKVVYNELGGCPGSTSAATCTRRHYERCEADSPQQSGRFRRGIDPSLPPPQVDAPVRGAPQSRSSGIQNPRIPDAP